LITINWKTRKTFYKSSIIMGKASMGSKSNSGGSSKGNSLSSVETTHKTRSLLTRGEKLIVLRNALFDDDEGGFGAERDVTRWLAPAFRAFEKNGVSATIEFSHGESLVGDELADLVDLAAVFSAEVEEDAGREYNADDKEEHLTEDAARFLLVRDNNNNKIIAFAHFRFTFPGELADEMEGDPSLFIYDLHVDEGFQRKGIAKHLMIILELIARKANMSDMLMPIPNTELADGAKLFMLDALKGWSEQDLSTIAPKTSKALREDGSLSVFVKTIKVREVEKEEVEEDKPVKLEMTQQVDTPGAAAAAAEDIEDDWGVDTISQQSSNKAGGKKKNNKNNKKKKNSGKKKQDDQTKATEKVVESIGTSNQAPIVLDE
jgi:GNAT superfamily N-acetyltransferase